MTTKTCKDCLNTSWYKGFGIDGAEVWKCGNCSNTRPIITRTPKGFFITTALCPIVGTYYLTADGWLTQEEIKGKEGKMCYYRKSKNIAFWLENPPSRTTVETTYTEI